MGRVLVLMAFGLLCAGCSLSSAPSTDDAVAQQASAAQLAAQSAADAEARAKAQDAQCLSYGLKPSSSGYKKCRADLVQQEEARRPAAVANAPASAGASAPTTTAAATPRRSRPMLDDDAPERVFNMCSYGGTITNCY